MNKKTLIILFWDLGIGGIQKRIRDLALEISATRSEWTVYILLRNRNVEGFDSQLLKLKNIHVLYCPSSTSRIRIRGIFLVWLMIKYSTIRPDSFLVFLPLLSIASVIIRSCIFWVKSRLIVNEGVLLSTYLDLRGILWMRHVIRFAYNSSDAIVVPTRACKDDLVSMFAVQESKISVIPNWTLLSPMVSRKAKYDIIYAGRFDAEKNILSIPDCIATVVKKLPKISVLLMGSGPLLLDLLAQISVLKLSGIIQVKKFDENISLYLQQSKVLLLPSHNEGMPNVVLEAAACSVPSVVSNFLGSQEIVLHGVTGFIGKTNEDRAGYICELLRNENLRKRLGVDAKIRVMKLYSKKTQSSFLDKVIS